MWLANPREASAKASDLTLIRTLSISAIFALGVFSLVAMGVLAR
jgi:hypothetical protein